MIAGAARRRPPPQAHTPNSCCGTVEPGEPVMAVAAGIMADGRPAAHRMLGDGLEASSPAKIRHSWRRPSTWFFTHHENRTRADLRAFHSDRRQWPGSNASCAREREISKSLGTSSRSRCCRWPARSASEAAPRRLNRSPSTDHEGAKKPKTPTTGTRSAAAAPRRSARRHDRSALYD